MVQTRAQILKMLGLLSLPLLSSVSTPVPTQSPIAAPDPTAAPSAAPTAGYQQYTFVIAPSEAPTSAPSRGTASAVPLPTICFSDADCATGQTCNMRRNRYLLFGAPNRVGGTCQVSLPPTPPTIICCADSCQYRADSDCDDGGPGNDYAFCDLGTDCTDCGSRCPPPSVPPLAASPSSPSSPLGSPPPPTAPPATIIVYAYDEGKVAKTSPSATATAKVQPGITYAVKVELLRNDLAGSDEYATSIKLGDKGSTLTHLGSCNPDGGDYDCTFFHCSDLSTTWKPTTDTAEFRIDLTGHSWDCDCDMSDTSPWTCAAQETVSTYTPVTAVARFTLVPA